MSLGLIVLLLGAAALHAGWNAIVRAAPEQAIEVRLVAVVAALIAACSLPFLPLPARAAWPYLAISAAIQVLYFELLGPIYRRAELSYAYPLMRGAAPVVTGLAGTLIIGEHFGVAGWTGILLLCGGVLVLGMETARSGAFSWHVTGFGLLNACAIAGYTITDGLGIRLSAAPWSYAAWLFALNGVMLLARGGGLRAARTAARLAARWHVIALCAAFMLISYSIALWAMTRAPVAAVAALRETSVLFATAFAALFLNERLGWPRYLAAAMVTAGAAAMRLS
jgi:drug/metabolite transporter (DMT)-like permease